MKFNLEFRIFKEFLRPSVLASQPKLFDLKIFNYNIIIQKLCIISKMCAILNILLPAEVENLFFCNCSRVIISCKM